jgi:hypothetical protein
MEIRHAANQVVIRWTKPFSGYDIDEERTKLVWEHQKSDSIDPTSRGRYETWYEDSCDALVEMGLTM